MAPVQLIKCRTESVFHALSNPQIDAYNSFFLSDKGEKSVTSERFVVFHVFYNVFHRSSCDYGANLFSVVGDSAPL